MTGSGPSLRRAALAVLAVVLTAAVVRRIRIAAGMRRGDQVVIDAKRHRNKRFANKMVTRVGRAGRPRSIFAVIDYIGRRSGRRYTTPVRVVERPVALSFRSPTGREPAGMSTCRPAPPNCIGRDTLFPLATRRLSPPALSPTNSITFAVSALARRHRPVCADPGPDQARRSHHTAA